MSSGAKSQAPLLGVGGRQEHHEVVGASDDCSDAEEGDGVLDSQAASVLEERPSPRGCERLFGGGAQK